VVGNTFSQSRVAVVSLPVRAGPIAAHEHDARNHLAASQMTLRKRCSAWDRLDYSLHGLANWTPA
jgi:hypothetical protein